MTTFLICIFFMSLAVMAFIVKKLGMACSYPGTFNSAVHSILTTTSFKSAVLKTIKSGGCNCSRVNFEVLNSL